MTDIKISKRHKRLLSSLFFVLEQKIESIEHKLNSPTENASYTIKKDLKEYEMHALKAGCSELKKEISRVSTDLDLPKRTISQFQYISTIQSQMWENISDAFSDNMKGYGKSMVSDAKPVDPYIRELSNLIDKLRI